MGFTQANQTMIVAIHRRDLSSTRFTVLKKVVPSISQGAGRGRKLGKTKIKLFKKIENDERGRKKSKKVKISLKNIDKEKLR